MGWLFWSTFFTFSNRVLFNINPYLRDFFNVLSCQCPLKIFVEKCLVTIFVRHNNNFCSRIQTRRDLSKQKIMNSGEEEPGEAAIPMSDLESHQSRVVNPEKSKEFSKWRVLGTLGLAVNRWKDKETPEERQRKWQNRRLRLVQRSYGGVKEDVVDNISTLPTRKKPSLLQYAKEEVLGYPPKTRDLVDTSNIVENILNRDDEPSREFGVGFTGHILNNQYDTDNYIPTDVRKQMDEMEDYRPFFSYWVTTVQTIILIITMCWYPLAPLGLQLVLRTDFIFTESLAYQQVSFYEPNNFWIGPSP